MKLIRNIALFAGISIITMVGISLASSQSGAMAPTDQEAFINAAESTINGVVSVKSYASPRAASSAYGGDDFFMDPFEFFFGNPGARRHQQQQPQQPQPERQIGLGSGVIISKDGYIVTNNHVIADAERLEVTLNDNRNFDAVIIGTDPNTDIALIKIEADDLHVIPIGNSEDLHVGEWVLAVGNPFGFTSTVTSGIVSAKGRNISAISGSPSNGGIESYIQTDAALNAGNSGGALVNLNGELMGINTAIYSKTGNYAGYSFAIPTTIMTKVVDDIKKYGAVQRAYLGVRFLELTPEIIKEKKVEGVNAGIYVAAVEDGSAAQEGGLKEGDVIVAVNGNPTTNTALMQEAMAKCSPGDKITVTIYRDGKKIDKQVVLLNGRGNTALTRINDITDLGCNFAPISNKTREALNIKNGLEVKDVVDGPMKAAGITNGFVILSINDITVSKPEDVEKIYTAVMKDENADKVLVIKCIDTTKKVRYKLIELE